MITKNSLRSLFIQRIRVNVYRIWKDPKNIVISIHIYFPHNKKSIKKTIDCVERRSKSIQKIRHCISSIHNVWHYHSVIAMIEHYGLVFGKDSTFDELLREATDQYFHKT